jgi:DNA-binding NtrC family response regulator
VTPLGALKPRPIDVRFVAATNRDLEQLVTANAFRSDLYYRLNGISICIPPLRDRRGEIPTLARLFANRAARSMNGPDPVIAEAAMDALTRSDWPGNVRELRNVVERAVVLARGGRIEAAHVAPLSAGAPARPSAPPPSLRNEVDTLERQRIVQALEQCGGNQTEAAKILGISRRSLLGKLDAHGLPRPRKR